MGARTNVEVGLDAAYNLLKTNADADTEKYIITLSKKDYSTDSVKQINVFDFLMSDTF